MMEACKQNNVKLTIGYRVQHEPNTIAINAYASSLPFGPIQSLEAAAGYHGGGVAQIGAFSEIWAVELCMTWVSIRSMACEVH